MSTKVLVADTWIFWKNNGADFFLNLSCWRHVASVSLPEENEEIYYFVVCAVAWPSSSVAAFRTFD